MDVRKREHEDEMVIKVAKFERQATKENGKKHRDEKKQVKMQSRSLERSFVNILRAKRKKGRRLAQTIFKKVKVNKL